MSDLFGNHIVGFPTRRLICKLSIAQNRDKIVAFQLRNGTSCTAEKYMELSRICAIISIAIFRHYPVLMTFSIAQQHHFNYYSIQSHISQFLLFDPFYPNVRLYKMLPKCSRWPCSVVRRRCRRRAPFSKIFSSETPGPINAKLHVEHP